MKILSIELPIGDYTQFFDVEVYFHVNPSKHSVEVTDWNVLEDIKVNPYQEKLILDAIEKYIDRCGGTIEVEAMDSFGDYLGEER